MGTLAQRARTLMPPGCSCLHSSAFFTAMLYYSRLQIFLLYLFSMHRRGRCQLQGCNWGITDFYVRLVVGQWARYIWRKIHASPPVRSPSKLFGTKHPPILMQRRRVKLNGSSSAK